MSEQKLSVERVSKVWDDSTGERIEVGPDSDGLNLVELMYVDSQGKEGARITMTTVQARLVSEQLLVVADEVQASEEADG